MNGINESAYRNYLTGVSSAPSFSTEQNRKYQEEIGNTFIGNSVRGSWSPKNQNVKSIQDRIRSEVESAKSSPWNNFRTMQAIYEKQNNGIELSALEKEYIRQRSLDIQRQNVKPSQYELYGKKLT